MVDTAQELLRRHWAVLCCAVPTLGQIAAASLSSSYLQRSNGLDTAVRSSHAPRGAIEGPEENWQSSRTSENTYNLERLGPTWSVRRLHVDGTSDRSLALVVECARCGFQKQEEKAVQVSWSDLTYLTTDFSTRLHLWRAISGISNQLETRQLPGFVSAVFRAPVLLLRCHLALPSLKPLKRSSRWHVATTFVRGCSNPICRNSVRSPRND